MLLGGMRKAWWVGMGYMGAVVLHGSRSMLVGGGRTGHSRWEALRVGRNADPHDSHHLPPIVTYL